MLSEGYLLLKALERAELAMPPEHPRVKLPGASSPCFRVALDKDGGVTRVDKVTEEEWSGLWTVMEGKQNSFPVVRIKEPVTDIPADDILWTQLGFDERGKRKRKPKLDVRLGVIARALERLTSALTIKAEKDWTRLRGKAAEFVERSRSGTPSHAALPEFARRFQAAAANPALLLHQIAEEAFRGLQAARLEKEAGDAVETLVVGKGPPKKRGKRPAMNVQLAFDLDECPASSCRIYSRAMRTHVIDILPIEHTQPAARRPASVLRHLARTCAFTGETSELQVSAFPSVRLPVLNKDFPLVSMFSEAPCNTRYGLTDAHVVPVAKETALRIVNALTYILGKDREGITWRGIASGKFRAVNGRKRDRLDLLIVYVDVSQISTQRLPICSAPMSWSSKSYSRSRRARSATP
jgi:hypothetical protein